MSGETTVQTTEDKILATMDLEDEQTPSTTEEASSTQPATPTTGEPGVSTTSEGVAAKSSDQPAPVGTQQPGATPAAQAPASTAEAIATDPGIRWAPDDKGNVVDKRTGQIVANAGRERRYFENWRKSEHGAATKDQYIRTLEGKVQTAEEAVRNAPQDTGLGQLPAQLGLNAQEAGMGLQLIHNLKTNPGQTIQNLLAEAQAMGYAPNVEGAPTPPAVNLEPIRRMIDERLAPLTTQQEQQRTEEAAANTARDQASRFLALNPDAAHHQEPIARLLNSDPNLSLDSAYYQLKLWAQQHGLDFNQPLPPQIQARAASQGKTGQPAQPGNGSVPPLNSGATPATDVTTTSQVAGADDSLDDIIKLSMREAGMKVN